MHQSHQMASVLWKNKKPVLFLSIHAILIGYPCMPVLTVHRRNGTKWEDIMASPMHLKYIIHMRNVDVAD
jgi:hypothetical protein